ncbi:ABC transporter permease [Streptomyces vastus]|uniref:Transport permease protein n=1 Tax=Streptomyces vastus TaxID=285451 RepID=A0ABN3QC46_9ACTN
MYFRSLRETRRIILVVMAVPLVVPIFMLVVFSRVFGDILQGTGLSGSTSYVQYVAPGAILMAVMLPATASVSVAIERQNGFYDRMRISPMGPRCSNLARRIGDATKLLGFALVLLLVSWVAGADIHNWPMALVLGGGLSALWGFGYSGLSFAACLRTGKAEIAEALLPAFFPLVFVSSAFVPLENLPGWMEAVATYNPLTYLCDAIRGAYTGDLDARATGIAVLSTVLMIALSQLLIARAEHKVASST